MPVDQASPRRADQVALQEDVAAIARIDVVPTILEVICRSTGMGFSAVARVTDTRWVACAVRDEIAFGLLPGGELSLETTICNEIRQSGERVVIDHVAQDPSFCGHRTPAMYGFQSYISVPIWLPGGHLFGTLCAIDPRPARLRNRETIGMFELFANLIALHLDAQRRLAASESALVTERQYAQLREQFIAVLGHDLRGSVSAIQICAKHLPAHDLDEESAHIATAIGKSAARMEDLIDNILDFALVRLGGGLPVILMMEPDLGHTLDHVVFEMRISNPERTIHSEVKVNVPVYGDRMRLAQLLENLVANALSHGDQSGPIWIRGAIIDDELELTVINRGTPIPPATLSRLFQPFTRGLGKTGNDGLGLGLYIASQIAIAHRGRLDVTCGEGRTRFMFRMPLH